MTYHRRCSVAASVEALVVEFRRLLQLERNREPEGPRRDSLDFDIALLWGIEGMAHRRTMWPQTEQESPALPQSQ